MFKDPAAKISPEQLEKNFADINPPQDLGFMFTRHIEDP